MKNKISVKWLKASIIGTVWASSEIVLGSFLHNLRVPFSGSLLAAIGIIILISSSYVWTEKGIFWRAGLICALLKTMSPSAVIFGPMIAIFSEALLLEISVRIFGRNYIGFFTGSILAASWNLLQRILNFLIFYGFNIIDLYKNLMKFAEKQLNLQFETLWIPILVLLSIYVLIGFVTAIIGIKTGKKIKSQPFKYEPKTYNNQIFINKTNTKQDFSYSIPWLMISISLIVTSILLISLTNWMIWGISSVIIVTIWIIKYKRALRQLSKPKFWIFFVVITMLTALVFTKLQSKSVFEAVLIGIEMNFRAVVLIIGFSVLGTELYNPKIRHFFGKTYFKQLPLALELSVESLPLVIANIPDSKTIIKNPASVVSQLIAYAEFRFKELHYKNYQQHIFIIKGQINTGKTTTLIKSIEILKERNIDIGGMYSPKIFENNVRIGYDVVDVSSNDREMFLRNNLNVDFEKVGSFSILPQGLKLGLESLKYEKTYGKQLIVIDEIGSLELLEKGWFERINELFKSQKYNLLIVVREELVGKVIEKWNLSNYTFFNINENDHLSISNQITEIIRSNT